MESLALRNSLLMGTPTAVWGILILRRLAYHGSFPPFMGRHPFREIVTSGPYFDIRSQITLIFAIRESLLDLFSKFVGEHGSYLRVFDVQRQLLMLMQLHPGRFRDLLRFVQW
jgi:hypothetical protein